MKKIYKYEIVRNKCAFPLIIPRGSEVVEVGMQHDVPTMWIVGDPSEPFQTVNFQIVGSEVFPENFEFVGTLRTESDYTILHVLKEKTHAD